MANVKLPKSLDPVKNAQKRMTYQGIYEKSDLSRLAEAVELVSSHSQVTVEFARDEQGLSYFSGQAEVSVVLECQRCSQLFDKQLYTDFCFSPVRQAEQSEDLPERYDPVELNEHGFINLFQLIEDELILSLPTVALHPIDECAITAEDMQFGDIDIIEPQPNPFAILRELKRDQE